MDKSLLILDDQRYTVGPLEASARARKLEVVTEESIISFKEIAEQWASEGRPYAAAIDMNLRDVRDLEIEELGASRQEIGNGETAGLAVARHVFMNGHLEPLRTALSQVPIAMISADDPSEHVRRDIEALGRDHPIGVAFVPKPDSPAASIPPGMTFDVFLDKFCGPQKFMGYTEEKAIFLDVQKLLKLSDVESIRLLGFQGAQVDLDAVFAEGTRPSSRDWQDRLKHLYDAVVTLLSIYSRTDARKWLNEPLDFLRGATPRTLLVNGGMAELLVVKALVFELAGR